ncbi:NUDIX hydrolase [Candidatus Roizmanbacteria bacterium]|nr:NUDIX hydrolase [Candidatus Roizmanbacteria bacterium]
MQEIEYVDVVNENGGVISSISKDEAHIKGLLHMTVISEVINSKGEWLLVKQANDRQDAGQYVSPIGGHVKSKESLKDALKREAWEEVGLKDFKFELVGKGIFNREVLGRKENHYFIMYKIFSDEEPTLNNESVSCERFTVEQIKKELKTNPQKFGAAFHFVWKRFFQTLILNLYGSRAV